MSLLLALSCLQSRPQDAALDELMALEPDGVQLTPGCLPTPGFEERVRREVPLVRVHHGFAWAAYRDEPWTPTGEPRIRERDRSLHPPRTAIGSDVSRVLEVALRHDLLLETMYPGERLGTGDVLDAALDAGVRLAVDVSHLFIQRCQGVLGDRTLGRLLASPSVEEIHVPDNDGRHDLHSSLRWETFLLDWARERGADLPVIVESAWHRVAPDDRRRQLDLLRCP